jgi:hypothetical protein
MSVRMHSQQLAADRKTNKKSRVTLQYLLGKRAIVREQQVRNVWSKMFHAVTLHKVIAQADRCISKRPINLVKIAGAFFRSKSVRTIEITQETEMNTKVKNRKRKSTTKPRGHQKSVANLLMEEN